MSGGHGGRRAGAGRPSGSGWKPDTAQSYRFRRVGTGPPGGWIGSIARRRGRLCEFSPKIEALCDEWLRAPDLAAQKAIAEKLQLQAFEDVPYIPLYQYLLPAIHQANLTGILKGITAFWNVRRM